jgi:TonB family protein
MAYSGIWQDTLPWSDSERDRKLTGFVVVALAITIVFFIIVQFLPLMDVKEKKLEEVAPRLAKLIVEKKAQPLPPPPKPKPKKKDQKKPKPKEKKPVKKPTPKPKPKPKQTAKPKPDRSAVARKKAQRAAAVVEDALADLRDFDVASLEKNKPIKSGATKSKADTTTTAIVAARAKEGSGGIDSSRLSRATGGGSLEGRSTTNVTSSIGSGGGSKGSRTGGASGKGSRPYEEIELVFQKNKGRIFSLYNRALRKDPSLQGKIVLELTIAPSGKVLKVRIVSSELNNPRLENSLKARVKGFRFKSRPNVDTLVVRYPIDFLPT